MKTSILIAAVTLTALAVNQPTVAQAQDDGSGNLSVELVDGTLFILGDQEPNKIIVSQFQDSEGVEQIVVGGDGANALEFLPWIPYDWTSYTTVNGGGPVLYDASDVAEVVLIAGRGDDQILLHGGLGPDILIDSGAGIDRVDSVNTVIVGDLYINTGKDRDRVVMIGADVVGNAEISTGEGHDEVVVRGGEFLVVVLTTHDGNDEVLIEGVFTSSVVVNTGKGNDEVLLRNTNTAYVGGSTRVNTGDGHDAIVIDSILTNELWVDAWRGNDLLELRGSSILTGHGAILLGGGSDVLDADASEGASFVLNYAYLTVRGERGRDTLINPDYFQPGQPWRLYIDGFEVIDD